MKKVFALILTLIALSFAQIIESAKEYTIVCVPFPCPSRATYAEVKENLITLAGYVDITSEDVEMITVLSPYGMDQYSDYFVGDGWWGTEIVNLKRILNNDYGYAVKYNSGGIEDEDWFWRVSYTPIYLIFHYGEFAKSGNLTEITSDLDL